MKQVLEGILNLTSTSVHQYTGTCEVGDFEDVTFRVQGIQDMAREILELKRIIEEKQNG